MNKMGRSLYLHIYLVVAESHQKAPVTDLDSVRGEITAKLSKSFPSLTADVIFTTKRQFAHL